MAGELNEYWIEKYKEDKVGTIAKLSQAMQHMAWLREWRRVHGREPRIKPITEKINGEKVKVGESNIAVAWSRLDDFFRAGNEYGDVETVKFLAERIERGDVSELTEQELHDLSERENVKWSDGKHSLNPFQGYLYDFTAKNSFTLDPAEQEDEYGKFYPIDEYRWAGESWQGLEDLMPNDSEHAIRTNQTHSAFRRYYTTRLVQQLLASKEDSKYHEFVDFDITSVTTPEQIAELDKKLAEIVQSPEIKSELERLEGDKDFEKAFYDKLREEVAIEIKKDSDRIENAHKVFVALETGKLDEIFEDPETQKWAMEVWEADLAKGVSALEEKVNNPNASGKSREELAMEILGTKNAALDEVFWVQTVENDLNNEEKCPYLNNPISKREILLSKLIGKPYPTYFIDGVRNDSHDGYRNEIRKGKTEEELKEIAQYAYDIGDRQAVGYENDEISESHNGKMHSIDEMGTLEFGYGRDGKKLDGRLEVSARDLYKAGIEHSDLGFEYGQVQSLENNSPKVTPKSIADADKEQALTTTEVGGIKGFIKKLLDRFKGKGEK